jgi:hypothetical protein
VPRSGKPGTIHALPYTSNYEDPQYAIFSINQSIDLSMREQTAAKLICISKNKKKEQRLSNTGSWFWCAMFATLHLYLKANDIRKIARY